MWGKMPWTPTELSTVRHFRLSSIRKTWTLGTGTQTERHTSRLYGNYPDHGTGTRCRNYSWRFIRGADNGLFIDRPCFCRCWHVGHFIRLATAIRKIGEYDLIIGGRQAIDGDTAQVGPAGSRKTGVKPGYLYGRNSECGRNGRITVKRHIDGGVETVKVRCLSCTDSERKCSSLPSAQCQTGYRNTNAETGADRKKPITAWWVWPGLTLN